MAGKISSLRGVAPLVSAFAFACSAAPPPSAPAPRATVVLGAPPAPSDLCRAADAVAAEVAANGRSARAMLAAGAVDPHEAKEMASALSADDLDRQLEAALEGLGVSGEKAQAMVAKPPPADSECVARARAAFGEFTKERALLDAASVSEPAARAVMQKDLAAALHDASAQHRDVAAIFCASFSEACGRALASFGKEPVKSAAGDLILVNVDLGPEDDAVAKLTKQYRIGVVPTVILFDEKGHEKKRAEGFHDEAALATFLRSR